MSARPARVDEVPEGELLGVLIDGQPVVVGRVNGRLYAIDGVCTHRYADLETGTLDGDTVLCRFHGSAFNIRTGAVLRPPATKSVESYTVTVENGCIFVDGMLAEIRVGYSGLQDNG